MLLALVVLLRLACAQDTPPAPSETETREGPVRKSPRLLLVIDVSGSMEGLAIGEAIQQAIELALAPTDDMEVGVIVFDDEFRLLEGPDGPNSFWYRFPDGPNAEKFQAAVRSLGTGGGTNPAHAMHFALLAEPQTLVLITDGGFQPDPTLLAIQAGLKTLQERGVSPPRFGVIGIDVNDVSRVVLQKIAKTLNGDLYERDLPKPPPQPEPPPDSNHRSPPIGPLPPLPPPPPIHGPY